jgi:glutamate racemase
MSSATELPIGVFDSGVGGLTVVRALRARLPNEHILYFGDTARVPYGVKSPDTVRQYASQITDFLLERRIKLLIIACNTVAAVAAEAVRSRADVPVLDVIEAGSEAALAATRSQRVGVIGTLTTIHSRAYDQAIRARRDDTAVHGQACPLFVPLVEEGWLDHPVTRLTATEYLSPLLQQDIDTLVLGCTHYPLLRDLLQDVAGDGIKLIDSAETTAEQAARRLTTDALLNPGPAPGQLSCFVTDVPQRFQAVGERFLGEPLNRIELLRW